MDYQKYVQMLKAMADPNRLKIIDLAFLDTFY